MPEVVLKIETRRALKIALGLRRSAILFEVFLATPLAPEGIVRDDFVQRRKQLLWLAEQFEGAVKAAAPELASHERPKVRNSKLVWCAGEGCTRALTLEQRRVSDRCPVCREKAAEQ